MQRSKLGKNGDDATGAAGSPASVDEPRTLRNYGDTVCGIVDDPLSATDRREVRRLASTHPLGPPCCLQTPSKPHNDPESSSTGRRKADLDAAVFE